MPPASYPQVIHNSWAIESPPDGQAPIGYRQQASPGFLDKNHRPASGLKAKDVNPG